MFVLDLIHRLIPVMGIQGRAGTPGGGSINSAVPTSGTRPSSQNRDFSRIEALDWTAVGAGIGKIGQVFEPNPAYGTDSEYKRDSFVSSVAEGVAISAQLGFADFGVVGAIHTVSSLLTDNQERKAYEREMERRKREQWERALEGHKARLNQLKGSISDQERQISMAKVAGIAAAAGQHELALDARVSAASRKGITNVTAHREAASARDNLEAKLMGQEAILDAKLDALDSIQDTIEKERTAHRNVGDIKTKHFDSFQKQLDEYDRRFNS